MRKIDPASLREKYAHLESMSASHDREIDTMLVLLAILEELQALHKTVGQRVEITGGPVGGYVAFESLEPPPAVTTEGGQSKAKRATATKD